MGDTLWKKVTKNTTSSSSTSSVVAQEATLIGESVSILENVRLHQTLASMETIKTKIIMVEKSIDSIYTILKNQKVKVKEDEEEESLEKDEPLIKTKKKGSSHKKVDAKPTGISKKSSDSSTKKRKVFEKKKFQTSM